MDNYSYNQQRIAYQMHARGLNPANPHHVAQFNYMVQQANPQPMYAVNPTGQPVNITNGFFITEVRGVFVKNLANEEAISSYFGDAGPIVHLALQRDHRTQKSKGSCTIHFNSAESAQNAITKFHGKAFMDMRLHVRAVKEHTAVDAPSAGPTPPQQPVRSGAPPVIVSSTPTQVRRIATRLDGQR